MLILSIDASSDLCSVALARNGDLLGFEINTEPFQHGRDINILIATLLEKCGCEFSDLAAISVNKGPGSYTALRIGMSTAKGLCYGLDIPLITPSGFDILISHARKIHPEASYYVSMIDARRMEVYTVDPTPDLQSIGEPKSMVLDPHSFENWSQEKVCFIGNGVSKWQAIWSNAEFWIGEQIEIDARMMVEISKTFFEKNFISNLFMTTPLYIKKPNITRSKKEYFN